MMMSAKAAPPTLRPTICGMSFTSADRVRRGCAWPPRQRNHTGWSSMDHRAGSDSPPRQQVGRDVAVRNPRAEPAFRRAASAFRSRVVASPISARSAARRARPGVPHWCGRAPRSQRRARGRPDQARRIIIHRAVDQRASGRSSASKASSMCQAPTRLP